MTARKKISVLGSTGSIGVSALDVIARNSDEFEVFALTANINHAKMLEQCLSFNPQIAVMKDADAAEKLHIALRQNGASVKVLSGGSAISEVASEAAVSIVVAGIVGAAGLLSTIAAVDAGKRVLLANKEALVMTGDLLLSRVRDAGAQLLPVDSEHNALFQCMPQNADGATLNGVERILLTASGGPFRGWRKDQLSKVTPEQAVAHPNWSMGKKISVDSATLMNKGLEVIEACYLFDVSPDRIDVVVHPESIIHSMVSYKDGSVLAQMGNPDMRTPIAHVLSWPERIVSGVAPLDLFQVAQLNFEKPDMDTFPCLQLAFDAVERGGTTAAVLNAANEVAVEEFLCGNMGFNRIAETIKHAMDSVTTTSADNLEQVLAADEEARKCAADYISAMV